MKLQAKQVYEKMHALKRPHRRPTRKYFGYLNGQLFPRKERPDIMAPIYTSFRLSGLIAC